MDQTNTSMPGGVGEFIVSAVERHHDREAFVWEGGSATYKEFGDDVSRTIQFLDSLGLQSGDRVMQVSANSYRMFVVMAACYVGGYVTVTPSYNAGADDHLYVLNDSGARILIADEPRSARAKKLADGHGECTHVFSHVSGTKLPHIWALIDSFEAKALDVRHQPDDIVRLIYTGGTTGQPKGVITLSSQLAFSALLHISEQNFSVESRMLTASPISHGSGSFIIPALFKGGCVVIHNGFDVDKTIEEISSGNVNMLFLVPTMLYALIDSVENTGIDLRGLRRIIYAAAPISPPRLKQALEIFGPVLTQNYGQTEVPGTVLSLTIEDHFDTRKDRFLSAGRPYPCVSVKLFDDTMQEVPRGPDVGEICVRAPHATHGYWNKPELTEELWQGGWLHTGDMARQDEDGYFYIVDRKKDMIISGGFNIYPKELEDVLVAHPAISSAAVVGIPHEKWGEVVTAIVVTKPGTNISETELIEYAKDKKGSVQAPKNVKFVDSLPQTNLGKIDKKALKAQYWTGYERAIN